METKPSKRFMKIYYLKSIIYLFLYIANYRTILHNMINNKLKALPPGDKRRLSVLGIV